MHRMTPENIVCHTLKKVLSINTQCSKNNTMYRNHGFFSNQM